ncbi:uncharacterized protein LOC105428845 [Pogonomyrmex barbatus]|uniref:Uncharacterized protein LOC105428845 n=1 Tax=Pogonomyrmex barbatus TaxID=144034 RepID=A0A8N1S8Y2_9HYME|nr:uncharacterized protein LOC105428845 [Pogonomyrmex barbatus]
MFLFSYVCERNVGIEAAYSILVILCVKCVFYNTEMLQEKNNIICRRIPSDSERNKFRRSSILKPRKPRQPLQNVNFDSSSDENSPVPSKIKRRVSFAEKKHVKEFCHSTEQGTVWDNTYEEHDSSLKGSSVTDQNGETESKENASLHNSNNSCVNKCINFESNSMSTHVIDDQISQKYVAIANEEDDTNYNLDFTNPISTDLSNVFQVENTALPSRFEDKISSISVTYNDKNEEHIELLDEKSYRQTVITNASHISKNIKPNNIIIYKDSDEEDYTNKVAKNYSELCPNNTSKLNETHIQDLSMELTTPISFLISANSHIEKQKTQKDDIINNIDTNYTSNYNNISMEITEAVPMSTMSVTSDLRIFKQIPMISQNCEETNGNVANNDHNVFSTAFNLQSDIVSKDIVSEQIQNCEDTKGDVANNDHNIFSTAFNLQSDIVSIDIISEQIQNVNCANDSMILTSVIQSSRDVIGTDTCHTNNVIVNNLMKATSISPKIYEKNTCNENVVKGNDLRKDQTDKTEIFNDIQMEMTVPVNTILSSNIYNKKNLKVDEPIFTNDKTTFLNLSMEMTKAVSTKSRQEITDTITCESLSKENIHSEKDKGTICLNEETRILHKSMEFTEVVSNSPHCEKIFNIIHTTRSSEKLPKTYLSAEKSTSTTFQTDADTRISDSNLRDSLNEINRCSFLRKSLENNLVELQSITPPSFECPDSEEENSSHQVQSEFQLPVVTDVSINNISDRLIINNVTETKYPIDSRKSVANDYFTNLTEKEESINNQTEDCYKKIIVDKIEDNQEVDCQETAKTIIDDNQLNESNCYITENKEMNEESILLTNTKNEEIMTMENINLNCTSLISTEIKVIDEDQINEREYTSKKVNKDTKLQDNIKIKRQYLNVEKKQEIDECDDHLNRTETVIKHQIKIVKKKKKI